MFLSRVTIIISLLFVLAGGSVFYIAYNSFVDQQYALAESVDDQTIRMLKGAREKKTFLEVLKKKPVQTNIVQ
ncbi:MAG: hypothetical protein ACYC5G_03945 [Candidatus Doudnabacteria bacterium]